jgi:hypothetical protein
MPRYLISFDDGSMDHIPEDDWATVGDAAHAVVREAKPAGVWIFGGGVQRQQSSIVAADEHHRRTRTRDKVGGRWVLDHRGALARGGARVGSTNRQSGSLLPRGSRDHVRPGVVNGVVR